MLECPRLRNPGRRNRGEPEPSEHGVGERRGRNADDATPTGLDANRLELAKSRPQFLIFREQGEERCFPVGVEFAIEIRMQQFVGCAE